MRKKTWMIALGIMAFFLLTIILGNVLTIGEKVGRVHPFLEVAFYVIAGGLLAWITLVPLLRVLRYPTDRVGDYMVETPAIPDKRLKKTVRRLLQDNRVSAGHRASLQQALTEKNNDLALATIQAVYIDRKATIEVEIERNSSLVMMASSLSQNGLLDAVAVIYYNVRMVRGIVEISGFRPTIKQLVRMYGDIFAAAFIFNTIEEIEPEAFLEDVLDSSGEKFFAKVFSKISGSVIQGVLSAYITAKVGYVTQYWLYMTEEDFQETNIKKLARGQARKTVGAILKKGAVAMPNQVTTYASKWFGKKVEAGAEEIVEGAQGAKEEPTNQEPA